ncbi:MAG: tape measure protein [Syntrophales bacterium]|jgi:tape measure domain-containing protein|nr:tape measure protein [Syntrophales bacterium]MCK9390260.1 tape measure protein [Syntrophales bacterium]
MANINTIAVQLIVKDDGSVVIKQFANNAEQALGKTGASVGSANRALDELKTHWLAATVAVAGMSYELGKAINASLEMERITSTMKAVAGTAAGAAAAFQFVRQESDRLGLVLSDTSLAYGKFAAATKNTSLEGEGAKRVFSGVSEAVTALRLKTDDANGIFLAMSQMMSKGRISAEELSGQLGERLPGAVRLTAEAMGMSTQQLLKHMENGELMSEDVLPKLADQLHKTYGAAAMEAAQGGQADINRFNNSLFETRAAIGDAVIPVFTDLLKLIGNAGAPIQAFIGGLKMSVVELYGFVDKTMAIPKMIKGAFAGANKNDMSEYGQFGAELYGSAGPEKHLSEWDKISANVKAQKDAIYNQMTRNADLAQSAPAKELSAQEKATKKIIELTQEAAAAIKKKNDDTYAGAEKLLAANIAKYRLAGVDEKTIAEYSATQRTMINQKYHSDTEKAFKAAAKKKAEAEKDLTLELEKTIVDRKKYEGSFSEWKAAEIETGFQKYREAGVSEVRIAELRKEKLINVNKEIYDTYKKALKSWEDDTKKKQADMMAADEKAAADTKKRAEDRRAAMRNLYKDLEQYSGNYYDVEKALIDDQAENYENILIDEKTSAEDAAKFEVAIATWRTQELKKLDIQKGKSSDNFFEGMKAGIGEIELAQKKWGSVGLATFQAMSSGMATTFSNVFEDAYKGDLKSISDYSTAIWDTMRQTFFKSATEMAEQKIILFLQPDWTDDGKSTLGIIDKLLGYAGVASNLSSYFSSDSGGMTDAAGTVFGSADELFAASGGGMVPGTAFGGDSPANDTVPAWLSPGEFVVPRTGVNADTREILEHIRKFGKAPGYASGGTVVPMTYDWLTGQMIEDVSSVEYAQRGNEEYAAAVQWWATASESEKAAVIARNASYLSGDSGFGGFMTNLIQGQIGGAIAATGRTIGEGIDSNIEGTAKILSYVPQAAGAVMMASNPAGWAAAAAWAAANTYAKQLAESSGKNINPTNAAIAAAAAAVSSYLSTTPELSSMSNIQIAKMVGGIAIKSLLSASMDKGAPGAGMGSIGDSALNGALTLSLFGGDGGGAGDILNKLFAGISGSKIISAKNGLAYVENDNTLINAHEGEGILTKEQNAQRLWGGGIAGMFGSLAGQSLTETGLSEKDQITRMFSVGAAPVADPVQSIADLIPAYIAPAIASISAQIPASIAAAFVPASSSFIPSNIPQSQFDESMGASPARGSGSTSGMTATKTGGGGKRMTINFNFPNAVVVDRNAVNELADMIYPRLKKLESWGH